MSSPSGGAQLQQSTVVSLALCCPFGLVIVANIETACFPAEMKLIHP